MNAANRPAQHQGRNHSAGPTSVGAASSAAVRVFDGLVGSRKTQGGEQADGRKAPVAAETPGNTLRVHFSHCAGYGTLAYYSLTSESGYLVSSPTAALRAIILNQTKRLDSGHRGHNGPGTGR